MCVFVCPCICGTSCWGYLVFHFTAPASRGWLDCFHPVLFALVTNNQMAKKNGNAPNFSHSQGKGWRNSSKHRCTGTSCSNSINSPVSLSWSLSPSTLLPLSFSPFQLSFHLFTPDVCLNLCRISAARKMWMLRGEVKIFSVYWPQYSFPKWAPLTTSVIIIYALCVH